MGNRTTENEKIIESIDKLYKNNLSQNNLINEINFNNQEIRRNNREIRRLEENIYEIIINTLEDIMEDGIFITIITQELLNN
tara:strand:- start:127 stop:372 length:246 start_codon:yes stop_codon:yes gene_type:complete